MKKPEHGKVFVHQKITDALYKAVADYVQAIGGSAMVIGGTEIQQYPDDPKYNYRLAIVITGKVPEKPKQAQK